MKIKLLQVKKGHGLQSQSNGICSFISGSQTLAYIIIITWGENPECGSHTLNFWFRKPGTGMRIRIPNKFPGDTDAEG